MLPTDPASWSDRLAATLARYDDALLRKVAGRLFKPRNFWPADELVRNIEDWKAVWPDAADEDRRRYEELIDEIKRGEW